MSIDKRFYLAHADTDDPAAAIRLLKALKARQAMRQATTSQEAAEASETPGGLTVPGED